MGYQSAMREGVEKGWGKESSGFQAANLNGIHVTGYGRIPQKADAFGGIIKKG